MRARTHLQEVLALDENHSEALRQHADVCAQLGDHQEQQRLLRQLIAVSDDPEDRCLALTQLANLLLSREDDRPILEAADLLEQALALAPGENKSH